MFLFYLFPIVLDSPAVVVIVAVIVFVVYVVLDNAFVDMAVSILSQ